LKLETGIRSLHWIHKDYYNQLVNFANGLDSKTQNELQLEIEEGEESKVNLKYGFLKTTDPNFTKKIPDDYFLLAILQNNYIFTLGVNEKIEFYNTRLLVNQDSVNFIPINAQDTNSELIIATGSKDGEVTFWRASIKDVTRICSFKYNNYHISSIKFNRVNKQTILCATSSHDRKIIVYEINITSNDTVTDVAIVPRMLFK